MMGNGPLGTHINPGNCDTGTGALTHSPVPGSLCGSRPSATQLEHLAIQAAHRLSTSVGGIDTRNAIGGFLGGQSFSAGAVAGALKGLASGIVELGWMLKMFAMAEYYESRHSIGFMAQVKQHAMHASLPGLSLMTMTAAAFWPGFDNQAREAFAERQAMIATVMYAFEHPGEMLAHIGDEQKEKYRQFKAYQERHSLGGQFHAGRLFGELLLDVLLILDGVTAIAKIAAKIPGLLKLLPRLRTMAPALRASAKAGGRAGKASESAARAAAEARKPSAGAAKPLAHSKPQEVAKPSNAHAGEKPQGKARKPCTCALAGKPVDVISGSKALFGQGERDFDLPAPLPLAWQRTYSSDNPLAGPLGQGWSLPISLALEFSPSAVTLQDGMHRDITFPLLMQGESFYSRHEQITLTRVNASVFELLDKDDVRNRFQRLNPDDRLARLASMEDRNGNRTSIDYNARQLPIKLTDSAGRIFSLSYDENNRLTGVAELRAAAPPDAAGLNAQPARVTVPLVTYEFDAAGDLVRVRNQAGETTREFGYRNHIMIRHAQPGGLVSDYEYSDYAPSGRVLRNHTNTGQAWQFVYAKGQTMVTDNLGRRMAYKFDDERRYTGMTDPMGGIEHRQLDAFGNLIALTDASGSTERYQCDARSRLTRIEAADGALTKIAYDLGCDKPATITDALGATTRLRHDSVGNLVSVIDALEQRTEYRYDKRGLLIELVDARGGSKRMAYNAAGQLTAYTDCSGQTTQFDYDRDGNLTLATDALGNCSAFRYDGAGRRIGASYPDGSSERYEYDALGRIIGHTDAAGQTTAYALDAEGRLLARTNALGGKLVYGYDGAKRLAQLVNENGAVYAFSYDSLDRLEQETGFDTRTTRYVYDKAGRPMAKTELGHCDAVAAGVINMPGDGAAIDTVYRRDAVGRMIEKTITGGSLHRVGGRVAPTVLPHHRTYGSVYGGSCFRLKLAQQYK